jgi:hypothetical protein
MADALVGVSCGGHRRSNWRVRLTVNRDANHPIHAGTGLETEKSDG